MKLCLADISYLRDSISIISELVTEGRFSITKNGVELVAMDPANVAMIIYKLLPSSFTEYHVDEPTMLGINLANLKQVLRRAGLTDTLTLEVQDGKLHITLEGASKRTFSLPIIALDEKEQKVPNLSFPSSATLPSSVLTNAIEDASIVAESVLFTIEPGLFTLTAEGDLNKASIQTRESDSTIILAEGKTKAKYAVEYLKKMTQGAKLSDTVTVRVDTNYPLKLEYKTIDKVSLEFILAPRGDDV